MFKHEYAFEVKWADTDAAAIVYSPNFYKWMDQATADLLRALGFPLSKLFEENLGIPLVESHCEFKTPASFEDMLRIATRIVKFGDKSMRLEHEIFKQDELLAKGYEVRVWVTIDRGKIKATSIPEKVREAIISYFGG